MPRLAWFTPLPPVRSGIAAYSAELLPLLARHHEIEVYVDPREPRVEGPLPAAVHASHEFLWRHDARPYDLVIYQLGNATCHDYMWPYLVRFPGLVVLHDAQLHHSRSRLLFAAGQHEQYRQEFAFCHRDANEDVAELIINGQVGPLYYLWPLIGVPVASARLVAVHSPWLAATLPEEYPEQEFALIRMGVGGGTESAAAVPNEDTRPDGRNPRHLRKDPLRNPPENLRNPIRERHALPEDRVVFAAYGMLTPEKRLTEIIRGLQSALPYAPDAHLMLVGQPVDWCDVEAEAQRCGVKDRVTVTGYVSDEDLPAYLDAADVCMCLRWPTSRETSASWLRCLAAGKPTVITELVHTCDVPALDPRSWTVLDGSGIDEAAGGGRQAQDRGVVAGEAPRERSNDGSGPSDFRTLGLPDRSPICVSIDIVDEQHSLGLAMRRLARDENLRRQLGQRAYEYWRRHHTTERMAGDYEAAIARALDRPAPDRSRLPAHLLSGGTGLTEVIITAFGLSVEGLGWRAGAQGSR